MKTVLLLVVNEGHFSELVRSARLLKASGRYRPIVVFLLENPVTPRDRARCFDEGIECVRADGEPYARESPTAAPRPPGWLRANFPSSWKPIAGRVIGALKRSPLSFASWTRYYRAQIARARGVIDRYRARLLVLAEDNPEYVTHCWVRAGHDRGARSVIVPYTVANKREAAEAFLRDPERWADATANRIAARLYPRWAFRYEDRELVRLPAGHLLALEALALAPALPWSHNSGFTDAIATESEFMRRRYLADELPAEKLYMTGTLADDVLAAGARDATARRRRLLSELGLADDRPLLLCALPPDQFPSNRPRFELHSQRDLCTFLVRTLGALRGWNVVYRLHPRVLRSDVPYLDELGACLTDWDTASLVPLCDVFVASASATIRWAIACGKPVVNYDVHRYRYHDFDDAPGVITVETMADFAATTTRLATDSAHRADLTARQAAIANVWGTLDGRAAERMLALFDRMSS